MDWAQMHVDAEINHCKTTSHSEVLPDVPSLKTLTSNRRPFFSREGPPGEPCTFLRSSYRCDSGDWPDWPVIIDNPGVHPSMITSAFSMSRSLESRFVFNFSFHRAFATLACRNLEFRAKEDELKSGFFLKCSHAQFARGSI